MRYIIPLVILGILVFFLSKGLEQDPYRIPSPLINKPVPDFVAADLITTHPPLTKKLFLNRHWSLLVVWSSWCKTCAAEQVFLLTLKQNADLRIYGLNYRDDLARAKAYLKHQGNPFHQIIFDPSGLLAIDLGVYGVPENFLIDPQGIIRYKYIGPLNKAIWDKEFIVRMNIPLNKALINPLDKIKKIAGKSSL
jgi:cytochrome c biogenesis protein CcmG/thiol:disulfide interchange protein DsbE